MHRVQSIIFVIAVGCLLLCSADWLVNIDGCENPNEFYSLFASNGNCFRQEKTFKKYQCAGSNYNLLTCTDSSCSTCKIAKTLPQSDCVANKAMICSTSEPDYSKYAGNSYWVQKFYSTADCSGQIAYTSVRGLDSCRSFVGTLYPSYIATCSGNTVTYVDYNIQTLNCTPNPNIPPQTFTYTTNICQQKSISTCIGN